MRWILASIAVVAAFALHGLDLYQKEKMARFVHRVYVDGQVKYDVDLDGFEKAQPKLDAYELAILLNAPSGALVLPIEMATWGTTNKRFNDVSKFHERILWQFGLFGILVWYGAGKFLDDARMAFSSDPDIRLRWYDWTFSILCLVSGFVLASVGLEEADFHTHISYAYSGFAWMLLGGISGIFRLFQWRSLRTSLHQVSSTVVS